MKCYKMLLSFNNIIYNVGSLIIICIIFFHIIFIFWFYINQLEIIKKRIKNIIFGIINISLKRKPEIKKNVIKFSKGKKRIKRRNNRNNKNTILQELKNNYKIKKQKESKINNNIFLNNNNKCINNKLKIAKNIMTEKNKNKKDCSELNNNKDKTIKRIKQLMKYNIDEMNDLSYNLALNYDKRTFCQYYISLIKVKHNLLFSFYNYDDYNSRIIKIDL